MRQFTEAEKLKLQTKIDDKKQRTHTIVKSGGISDEPLQRQSRVTKDGTLEIILFLTVLSLILLLWSWDNIGFNYMPLIAALMLLFNHIAFSVTKQSRMHRLMKIVARVWIIFVGSCLILEWYDLIRLTLK